MSLLLVAQRSIIRLLPRLSAHRIYLNVLRFQRWPPCERGGQFLVSLGGQFTVSPDTAKAAVSAWVKEHPKAAVVPLNAIQSIAKHKKLNEAALARAAIEVLGGLDKKAQKMLETSLVG